MITGKRSLILPVLAIAFVSAFVPGVANAADSPDVGRRSGLPFDSGVFAHDAVVEAGELGRVADFERVTGRPVDVWQIAPDRENGIDGMISETGRIAALVPDGVQVDWATPLMTREQAARFGRAACKASPSAYFRPGWEFNLYGSWAWTTDRIGNAEFVRQFRDTIAGAKSTCPSLRATWNPNSGQGGVERAMQAWPGTEYVDVIGLDVYDWSYEQPVTMDGGLDDWAAHTRKLGKKMSLPEWGTHGVKGRGDNPAFVRDVLAWQQRNADIVVMMSFFDEPESYIKNSVGAGQMPQTGQALRSGFTALARRPAKVLANPASEATPAPAVEPAVSDAPGLPVRVTAPLPPALRRPFQSRIQGPPPVTTYELVWGDGGLQIKETQP